MLHLLYILAFTTLAVLAVGNLIRSLIMLSAESRTYPPSGWNQGSPASGGHRYQSRQVPHPEMLDEAGNVVNEPLLVMRSMTVEDARERLDAIYKSSPTAGESANEA